MKKNISFDSLPAAIMELAENVELIISLLSTKIEKREEIPKYLNMEKALVYLKKIGFPMSKSKLYKLTANGKIPFHKSGNTLLFRMEEINQWCEDEIHANENKKLINQLNIKTVQKKNHKKCNYEK